MALQQLQDIYLATTVTPGEKPAANQLQLGELAFNAADRLGFLGTGDGAYYEFPLGGGPAAGGTVTQGPVAPATPQQGHIWVNTTPNPPELNLWGGAGWVTVPPDGVLHGLSDVDDAAVAAVTAANVKGILVRDGSVAADGSPGAYKMVEVLDLGSF